MKRIHGRRYAVTSSYGHIATSEVQNRRGRGACYAPTYVIPPKQKVRVTESSLAKTANEIYIATDDDREERPSVGIWRTSSAWIRPRHGALCFMRSPSAIEEAIQHPRPLKLGQSERPASSARLDRLVGYELSPFLWKKVARGLSPAACSRWRFDLWWSARARARRLQDRGVLDA